MTPLSIHVLMSQVMQDIGAIGKDSYNRQQGFAFRGIDAVMGALHPALIKHGVFFVPEVIDRERLDFTTSKGTQMEAVHLHVKFTFYGPTGDYVSCSAWGEASDAGDKATGKAMSMALKSALLQTFCVPTEDTEDADATSVERGQHIDPMATLRSAIAAEARRIGLAVPEGVEADYARTTQGLIFTDATHAELQTYLDALRQRAAA